MNSLARVGCQPGAYCGDVLLSPEQMEDILKLKAALLFLSEVSARQNLSRVTEVSDLDDNSYLDWEGPLPVC